MTEPRQHPIEHRTEHTLVVAAPARALYGLVADVTLWPAVFGPSVHVQHLERGEGTERFEIWALVNGEVSNWTSRRTLDPERLHVTFRQERSRGRIGSMGGEWIFNELPGDRTEIVLVHLFTPADDDPGTVEWINAALDRNSPLELAALGRIAELGHPVEDVVFSFTDTLPLQASAKGAYEFVNRADLWAERLPHVGRVSLTETVPGVQELEMDTVTADGSAHTTRSVRVCRAPEWIAYKQQLTPRLLLGHSGLWTFTDGPDGPVAHARHTVAIDPSAVTGVLGADATLADARTYVRDALGRNSLTTMEHAARAEAL
ncbi:aromatase/cyclase [Kitasatospora herbaricolor]|uniref:Aromatase/cyclase n=1 Tax=Kitasatospora herbaricolor TaxID=68217 RepID=A0ABZ1WCV3_9ACTN|nr:aromatase/cyclase [Kitasatospora herbaricolor]